jgi:hypothetical protein
MHQIRAKVNMCMRVFSAYFCIVFCPRMLLKVAGFNSLRRKENQCNNKTYYFPFFDMSGAMPLCFIGRSVLILHAWQAYDTRTLYGVCHSRLKILSV